MRETQFRHRVADHLAAIYPDHPAQEQWVEQIVTMASQAQIPQASGEKWSEQTAVLIAYGDSLSSPGHSPLETMHQFFVDRLEPTFTTLHLLPYYPATSDDGFSVADYLAIDPALGDWSDVRALSQSVQLMADLVLNHCSQHNPWFQGYLAGDPEFSDYFFEPGPEFDLSQVVRPRPQPVLQSFDDRQIWCTFSRDQVDLNYANPEVLFRMLRVVLTYLEQGARLLRLDAVAFLWKRSGRPCVNEPETHEVIRLIRTLVDQVAPHAVLVTETNLPNQENLSYFGNGNEAHWVYNFPLPPLATYALLHADATPLRRWAMSLPPALPGMTYMNFLASHDGMGLRPTEGLLTQDQFDGFTLRLQANGARISLRTKPDGSKAPYEANITLFSALSATDSDPDGRYAVDRFLAAHAIMCALEGVPAVYVNSLIGQRNDDLAVERSQIPRRINRTKYQRDQFESAMDAGEGAEVFNGIQNLLRVRQRQSAFHPNATQFTLQLPEQFFGLWRQSLDRQSNLFAVTNLSDQPQTLPLSSLNLITGEVWHDLLDDCAIEESQLEVAFKPYQTRWISRRR